MGALVTNINTVSKYSTKKKDLNPKMKMGTNSFGVHIVKSYICDVAGGGLCISAMAPCQHLDVSIRNVHVARN